MPRPSHLQLGDGRLLAYAEYGDPAGDPVVWHHGGLSCRLDAARTAGPARAAGVRVVAPDRPGVGRSSRRPGRSLLDWPDDLLALVDALGIERFGVAGWSLGGPFAAAAAVALSDRVTAVALVASAIPRDWDGMAEEINATDCRLMTLTRTHPRRARLVFRAMGLTARLAPGVFTRRTGHELSAAQRRVLAEEPRHWLPEAVAEGLRQPAGVVDEYRILDAPWGFDPGALPVPVHLWQGDDDRMVPPAWAHRLADRIPHAVVTTVPGAGHFLPAAHFEAIFRAAA